MSATQFLVNEFQDAMNKTVGAIFIGFAVACCLYGVLLNQVLGYFQRYSMDRAVYKISVLFLLMLETLDQAFIAYTLYYYTIQNFGSPIVAIEARMKWPLLATIMVGALSGATVKTFFGLRVWRFSGRNVWITGVIFLLTFGQLGLALVYIARGSQLGNIFSAVHHLKLLGTVSLGTGVLTDVITAAALCFYLNRLRTGLNNSDSLITSLSKYAINTGLVTSAASGGTLILYNVLSDQNLVFAAVYFITSKLYAISFLATLNTRRTISGRGTECEAETNNTNMFHLGTRMPTVGGIEAGFQYWDTRKLNWSENKVPQLPYASGECP